MKPAASGSRSRRKSLRVRMVVTFAGLAVAPFVAGLSALYFVARHDVGQLQGESLAQEARLLEELVQNQVAAVGEAASGLANLPRVRRYLTGKGPMPADLLEEIPGVVPGLIRLELTRQGSAGGAPVGPAEGSASWGTAETLEYRIAVLGDDGSPLGQLQASFDLSRLRRSLEWFHRGERGRAVLFSADGRRLAGSDDVPLPPLGRGSTGWTVFEAGGESLFAGYSIVEPGSSGLTRDWHLAVVQPAEEIYGAFSFVARQLAVLFGVLALVLAALAWRVANQFLQPILKIRSGAEIISRTNLGHRIQVDTGDELQDLADSFNRMAESLERAYGELEAKVRQTTRSLQEERNRLATVLRTMVEGVVVTNEAADVLLMNPRARLLLESGPASGIGLPLGKILPEERLEFYLRRIRKGWDEGREVVEDVVFPLPGGPLLRGLLSAVPGPGGERAGFLLAFRGTGPEAEEQRHIHKVLRELPELLRGPAATVRSMVEALERHPETPEEKRRTFLEAIREEVGRMVDRLTAAEEAAGKGTRWAGVPSDPRQLVGDAMAAVAGVFAEIEAPEGPVPPVTVEPFSWVAGLAAVLRWMAERSSGWVPVKAVLRVDEGTVITSFRVDGTFDGGPEELGTLAVAPAGEDPLPLAEVVRRNRGEVWSRSRGDAFEVCLGLERAADVHGPARSDGIADEQPEFYDFDLFLPRPAVEPEERLATPLKELECVVFDTETTGLQPGKGDRVVSLSAIRVRRGKVQPGDTFHTLCNPERAIPPESTEFHGIVDEMVEGAPRIEDILQTFYDYVGDSVLVAHNAAFDKKFLDLAAADAGLPTLENPILDTLFLSYGIHRDFEGHNLDAIAERLGVEVQNRHTSQGDARATAEVFLRLIPLLASRGVTTLGQAKAFCDRMLLLRWQTARF